MTAPDETATGPGRMLEADKAAVGWAAVTAVTAVLISIRYSYDLNLKEHGWRDLGRTRMSLVRRIFHVNYRSAHTLCTAVVGL